MTDPTFFRLDEWHLEGMINISEYLGLSRKIDQESNDGKRSRRRTSNFKTLAKARVKSAASGPSSVPGITLYADGTWRRDGKKA